MGRQSAWHGLLIAGAIALAAAQTVHAEPLQLPQVTVPQVTVPQVTVPPVTVPQVVPVPQVSVPQVTVPQVTVPQVSVPQVSVPQVSRPTASRGSRPAAPQVATNPLSNTPTPTRTQQRAGAPRTQTQSSAAPVGPAGSSAGSGSSGAPRSSGDGKAGARTPARRGGRTAREPSTKRLRRLLEPLAGCVATLGPLQERVLVRRAGLRGFKPQTRRQLAKTLHTSRTRVARIERRALGNLRRTVRAGGCAAPASGAPVPGSASTSGGTLVAEQIAAPADTARRLGERARGGQGHLRVGVGLRGRERGERRARRARHHQRARAQLRSRITRSCSRSRCCCDAALRRAVRARAAALGSRPAAPCGRGRPGSHATPASRRCVRCGHPRTRTSSSTRASDRRL